MAVDGGVAVVEPESEEESLDLWRTFRCGLESGALLISSLTLLELVEPALNDDDDDEEDNVLLLLLTTVYGMSRQGGRS
jgi:hypothetical protein